MYGSFCSLHLCLHNNQIVHDGISSLANKLAKKMYESSSATKIFLKFEILWVKAFQIAKVNTEKTSVTRVIPN